MNKKMSQLFKRYQELQKYVNWNKDDILRIKSARDILQHSFPKLVEDFYDEIQRHPEAAKVVKGGPKQINRLKQTLLTWLQDLVSCNYDADYVYHRWKVGWRHVEIGLDQVYTNVALSRLRSGMCQTLQDNWTGKLEDFAATVRSLNKLLDLDLAIIEDAYQEENLLRVRKRSEATFQTLVEAARCLIVILRPDHSICYFSPGAEQITGYPAVEVLGKDYIPLLVPSENSQEVEGKVKEAFAGKPTSGNENLVNCRDGHQRWMMWNAQCLPEYEGGAALMVIGHDITAFKESQERALQAERLAAIGQMVTGLAHESGNALARSQACLEMLSLEVEDVPEALELIQRIQKAQDHLRQLYDDVRGYAAPLKLERDEWDISGIWRQAWKNLESWWKNRNVELSESLNGNRLTCQVDNFRIEQVFRNIFENSLSACKDPVSIQVHCESTTLEGNPALKITFQDNGPGLDIKQRQQIFNPFFTTKSKGTGLGMAIAKRIIEAHQGQIAVGESESPGAEIIITLPRDEL